MEDPKIKTDVKHSISNDAWNVVGTKLAGKYKIARVPYVTKHGMSEAYKHAQFISFCFNHSTEILEHFKLLDK